MNAISVSLGTANKTMAYPGETITVSADAPASGMAFDKWVGNGVVFADATRADTTFTMPNNDVSIFATYKVAANVITIVGGTADKILATPGSIVTVTASVPSGYVFDKWTGSGVTFADANTKETYFVMPSSAVTVTASFKAELATTTTTTEPTVIIVTEPIATSTTESTTPTEPSATSITETVTVTESTTTTEPGVIVTEPGATSTTETATATEPGATATESSATSATNVDVVAGDANGDGEVTMKDVLALRKSLAGLSFTISNANADVNGDGEVNMKDVLLLRKYLAGLVDKLGA